jgi:putative transposase
VGWRSVSTQTDAMTDAGGEAPQGAGPSGQVLPEDLAEQLVAQARSAGVALTGPGGLPAGLTKQVLETALNAEMSEHLGHEHGEPAGRSGNVRNGYSAKTVRTRSEMCGSRSPGPARDVRAGDGAQARQAHVRLRRVRLSPYAKGMTTGDIVTHLQDVYGSSVSKDLVSRVTDAVLEQMRAWQSRPLDALYPVVLVDAIHFKIREGQVHNRPVYVVMGITLDGERDVPGLWAGPAGGGEGARPGWACSRS